MRSRARSVLVAELAQHVGRRRLLGAPLEHPDEQRDAGDRLVEVVRDHVGVAAQLGLHAPLPGHVGEEVDQPVAELGAPLDEGAEHVAVAERRVVGDLVDPRLAGLAHPDVGVEGAAAAHRRQRLQQRVAVPRRGRQPEGAQDRGVAVAEREVDDPAVVVAERPQHADRLGEAVEQRAELGRALLAEQLDELRILAPVLRLEDGSRRPPPAEHRGAGVPRLMP